MSWLTKFSLRNPAAIVLLCLLITIGGLFAAGKFQQEQMPDITMPGLSVMAVYPGASPNEVLNSVTIPIEQTLRNVEGTKNVFSNTQNSVVFFQLEYSFSDDMKAKQAEVEDALKNVNLPADVETPTVQRFTTMDQAMMYTSVQGGEGMTEEQLDAFVGQTLLPRLTSIEGISEVETYGLTNEGATILLDANALEQQGIAYDQVLQVLQANNINAPLGEMNLDQKVAPVFVRGAIESPEALESIVLSPQPKVTLADVADIRFGQDAEVLSRTDGNPSVSLFIHKSSTANTVEVSDKVNEIYDEYTEKGQIEALIMYDRASDVKSSIETMLREGGLGALFASILILLFLRNIRATIIAIVSIPLSILVTLILLKNFTDVTLNIMTLGGLAVATGRVVDDSIVVIENVVRRLQKELISKEMLVSATKEVGTAITSSTITTVAVFAPLGMLSGITGEFFRPFALTVAFALLASLVVSLTVVPLMSWALMRRNVPKEHGENGLSRSYKKLLKWSLNHKVIVLVLAIVLVIGSIVPIGAGAVGMTFLPETDYKYMFARLEMPKGTDLATLEQEALKLDETLRTSESVKSTQVTVGFQNQNLVETNIADWFIGLTSDTDLKAFKDEMRPQLNLPADSTFDFQEDMGGGTIAITLNGTNMDDIRVAAESVSTMLTNLEGTANVKHNLQEGTKGVEIAVRQDDAMEAGMSAIQASMAIRPFLQQQVIGKLGTGTDATDLYMALDSESMNSIEAIENMKLSTPFGTMISVKDIADVREVQLPGTLQLKNGAEYATVTASITDKNTSKVNAEMKKQLEKLDLPDSVTYDLGGSNEEINSMMSDMMMAMLVAVFMVYIVMVVALREAKAPLAILFSLPFAFIGGLFGTMVTGEPISISSMIGFLMLIGIVVTNAIVLIERVQQQIDKGMTIREALIEAGGVRLRPILMTAIATIFALLPLAIGLGGGSIISSGLAVVVIGGLAFSTLLTLVIVPVMYELLYFRKSRKQRKQLAADQATLAA